jgi:uncharacterized protein YybS (DUF2232 family)
MGYKQNQVMPSSRLYPFVIAVGIIIPWMSSPLVVAYVVQRNANAGLYGIADAVLIPIMNATMVFFVGCIYFGLLLWIIIRRIKHTQANSEIRLNLQAIIAFLVILPGLLFLSLQCLYWWSWSHAPIVLIYIVPILWLLYMWPVLARKNIT